MSSIDNNFLKPLIENYELFQKDLNLLAIHLQKFILTTKANWGNSKKIKRPPAPTPSKTIAIDKKVDFAFKRFLAVSGMVVGIYISLNFSLNLKKLALGSLIYVVNRDIFVIFKNATNQSNDPISEITAGATTLVENVKDFITSEKKHNATPHHPVTDNTFLRSLWDKEILLKLPKL